tara:strand:- start:315 stop:653 length:339 start_codon:yes stop_codon:yes gene_type:complete
MIILESLTSNEIKYISRQGTPFEVEVRDEQTKEVSSINPTFSSQGYYTVFTLEQILIENRKYQLTIKDSSEEVLYRDLLFVTTQEVEQYTVNKDEYQIIEDTSTSSSKYKII